MKKNKGDKNQKKGDHGHSVETPAPPQVMDPSAPPTKNEGGESQPDEKDKKRKADGKRSPEPEKLAPAEEL